MQRKKKRNNYEYTYPARCDVNRRLIRNMSFNFPSSSSRAAVRTGVCDGSTSGGQPCASCKALVLIILTRSYLLNKEFEPSDVYTDVMCKGDYPCTRTRLYAHVSTTSPPNFKNENTTKIFVDFIKQWHTHG